MMNLHAEFHENWQEHLEYKGDYRVVTNYAVLGD